MLHIEVYITIESFIKVLSVSGIDNSGADPGFWEREGLINIFTAEGRVREGAYPLS